MQILSITSKKEREIIDITSKIQNIARKEPKTKEGFYQLFTPHTTAALTTAYIDPAMELEYIDAFDVVLSKPTFYTTKYAHKHHLTHLPSHVTAAYFGPSLSIPIKNAKLVLGKFQRIILVELNGPRKRMVYVGLQT